ncbi:MAG: hypothetical protein PHT54_03755 [Candidatus Nanoarchaeia archaeon]|nr:hypothetical protein [Candidatus Nanoarchaeia archaeon]
MADVVITYETLYEILRREKFREELQKLNETFFQDIVNYLKDKKSILESQQNKVSIFTSVETSKTKRQIENTVKILNELYERRESKIVRMAMFSSRSEDNVEVSALLPEEKELYEQLKTTLDGFRKGILFNLLSEKMPEILKNNHAKDLKTPEEAKDNILIKFKEAVPKFIGDDTNIYGPFEPEDLANLPKKTAALLIEKNRAERI